MIAKVQPSKRKSKSSFKRLLDYLTKELDPESGETLLRGDVVLSNNLVSIDTAAAEMKALGFFNPRCNDPVVHYELAWPPGERLTRAEWADCALHTLDKLGFAEHQYVIVAHDDKEHFHIHVMVNKIHPETYKSHTPSFSWLTLDAAARFLEAKYGWSHTRGPMRWDEDTKQAVPVSKSERNASRSDKRPPSQGAEKLEHYHDAESVQTYVRREVASSVRQLLTQHNVTWDNLHLLLSKAHLRVEKSESGGYTVLAIDHNIRVKASDVFRQNFAGKINRQATETALGPWTPALTSLQHTAPHVAQHGGRNTTLREERKEQRRRDRDALISEYNQYRNGQRAVCKGITAQGRKDRQNLLNILRLQKKEIRASALTWPDKNVLLSQAAAQAVLELRALKLSVQQKRQQAFPKKLRAWVAERAAEGDARAAAQLRGWRYADQRNQRRLDATLELGALHIGPSPDADTRTDWAELAQQRLTAQQREQALAIQFAAPQIWTVNRRTGDVSYMLRGSVSVIDRGRIVTVLNQDEAAVLFGLEMAVQKYGSHIACTGTEEWKRMVVKTAAQHGISVRFTDAEMQYALRLQQRRTNPLQRQNERDGR